MFYHQASKEQDNTNVRRTKTLLSPVLKGESNPIAGASGNAAGAHESGVKNADNIFTPNVGANGAAGTSAITGSVTNKVIEESLGGANASSAPPLSNSDDSSRNTGASDVGEKGLARRYDSHPD